MTIRMYEGILRNRKKLLKELGISQGPDRRETERRLIEAGYQRWGHELPCHLYGSFAFAIWDEAKKELFLARDPFGIQNMYYWASKNGAFLCGSSLDPIVRNPHYRKSIDEEALQLYVLFGYPIGEKTLYEGIHKLMPGCTLIWDGKNVQIQHWFSPSFHPDLSLSEEEWIHKIDQTLQEILEEDRSCLDFTNSCVFLSGGIDSSYLLAASGAPQAAGIGFAESGFNEASTARTTAEQAGVRFHEMRISAGQFFEIIPRFLRNLELPLADPCAPAIALGCEMASEKAGPFLSGEGADEFFAGYYIYRCVEEPKEKYVPYCSCSMVIDQEEGMRFFQNWKEYPFEKLVAEISGKIQDADRLSRMIGVDSSLWLEGDILFGAGRSARASGIDLLMPFVDRRMFELSAVIPSTLKRKNGIAKYILRKAAQLRIPHETAFRPKIGFSVPARLWFREKRFRPRIEQALFGPVSRIYFNQDVLRDSWESFLEGNDYFWRISYTVYLFVQWYETCYSHYTG